jgi:EAL domain-containing protein (putative c-di-GMP-specific phosphodiesterase class I)
VTEGQRFAEPVRHGRRYVEAAIRARAFSLVYQPIVDLGTGRLLGVEALCRFHDGRAPDAWFDQCEELDLSVPMDLAILELAMADLDRLPDGYLALNLAIGTLSSGDALLRILRPALSRRLVVLELSERVVVDDYETMRQQLLPLRRAGILLAVDDTGAGYSSAQHIVQLRPDLFKLDRSFVASVDTDRARRAFAIAAVVLAKELGCTMIAEGVETAAELATLRLIGVGAAQGYFIGHPQRLPLAPLDDTPPRVTVDITNDESPSSVVNEMRRSLSVIEGTSAALRGQEADDTANRRMLCDRISAEVALMADALGAVSAGGPVTHAVSVRDVRPQQGTGQSAAVTTPWS